MSCSALGTATPFRAPQLFTSSQARNQVRCRWWCFWMRLNLCVGLGWSRVEALLNVPPSLRCRRRGVSPWVGLLQSSHLWSIPWNDPSMALVAMSSLKASPAIISDLSMPAGSGERPGQAPSSPAASSEQQPHTGPTLQTGLKRTLALLKGANQKKNGMSFRAPGSNCRTT